MRAVAALAAALLVATSVHAHTYEMYGRNIETGESVLAVLKTQNGTDHLTGYVWDRRHKVCVSGDWSGKGMVRAAGAGNRVYDLEVVE